MFVQKMHRGIVHFHIEFFHIFTWFFTFFDICNENGKRLHSLRISFVNFKIQKVFIIDIKLRTKLGIIITSESKICRR